MNTIDYSNVLGQGVLFRALGEEVDLKCSRTTVFFTWGNIGRKMWPSRGLLELLQNGPIFQFMLPPHLFEVAAISTLERDRIHGSGEQKNIAAVKPA